MTCRWLSNEQNRQLVELRAFLERVRLSQEEDVPIWLWNKKKEHSLLRQCMIIFFMLVLIDHLGIFRKAKLPLKIRIWLWLISHNDIATKDNMIKRKWVGDPLCRFCHDNAKYSSPFHCSAAKYVWSIVRNYWC